MITIYGKEGCSKCQEAKDFLDKKGEEYVYYDLKKKDNKEARKHFREKGWNELPVLVINTIPSYTIRGFNAELVEEILCATKKTK